MRWGSPLFYMGMFPTSAIGSYSGGARINQIVGQRKSHK